MISRPRANNLLGLWSPLTVVRGLQGYGKTTAVADWLRGQPDTVHSIWLTATAAMQDPEGLRCALARRLSSAGAIDHGPADRAAGPADLLTQMAHRIPARDRMVLVLDHADYLESAAAVDLISAVVEHEQLHLITISRGPSRLESAAVGVLETQQVSGGQLLFTVAEIEDLARAMKVSLAADDARRLQDAVAGWPAAVRHVLEGMTGYEDNATARPGFSLARCDSYLRETVLPGVRNQQLLRQLMPFALADRLTHQMIRDLSTAISPAVPPDQLIELVEGLGLAERRYTESDIEVWTPSLVRRILAEEFGNREPDAARAMHRRLADWHSDRAGETHVRQAFRHAALGQDWDHFDRIWLLHAANLSMSQAASTAQILAAVPDQVISTRPGMRVGLSVTIGAAAAADSDLDGRTATIRNYVDSSKWFDLNAPQLKLHDLLYVGVGQLVGRRFAGNSADAEALADRIERKAAVLASHGDLPGDQWGWFHLQRGLTRTLLGRPDLAIQSYLLSWQHRAAGAPYVAANVAANLAMSYALQGESDRAEHWLDRHRAIDTSQGWGHQLVGIGAHIAAGLLALDRLDKTTVQAELAALPPATANFELWPFVGYLRSQFGLFYDDSDAALGALEDARRLHGVDPAGHPAAVVLLERSRRDLQNAAGRGHRLKDPPGRSIEDPVLAVPLARARLLAGDWAGARRIATARAHPLAAVRERMELLIIAAQAARRMGEIHGSAGLFGQALALRSTGLLRPFATVPADELEALSDLVASASPHTQRLEPPGHSSPYPAIAPTIKLTKREHLLITHLATTSSRQAIADRLYVSVNTVRTQLGTLYRKLQVNNRDDALLRLSELGLDRPER